MSKRKPFRRPGGQDHQKSFERFQGHMVFEQLASEHARRMRQDAHEAHTAEQMASAEARRLAKHQGKLTAKNLKIAKELVHQKADLASRPNATSYFRGDIRVTPITADANNVYKRLTKVVGLSHEEAMMLMRNLDKFPNIRFEFDIWTQSTIVTWDDEDPAV